MSGKELKKLSVLQEVCDKRLTQSKAAQLLQLSERQIRRLIQNYKAHGAISLAHTHRGQPSNSKLSEEIRIQCLSIVSEQLYGFGPTLAHEKLTTVDDIFTWRESRRVSKSLTTTYDKCIYILKTSNKIIV